MTNIPGEQGSRRRRINEHELRVHAALVACALLLMAALSLVGAGTPAAFRKPTFPDFAQFYAGARMLAAGDADRLYVPRAFLDELAASVPWTQETLFPPVYPAHVYAAFRPLARLPYGTAALIFAGLSLAVYAWAVHVLAAPSHVPRTLRWLAIANPALLHVVMSGQVSTVALATLALTWRAWRVGHMFAAGLCLGSLAWKPQLLLIGAMAFAVRPSARLAAGGAAAVAVHAALFTAVAGPGAWWSYAKVLALVSDSPGVFSKVHQLQSLKGAVALVLPQGSLRIVVLCVLIAAALAVTVYIGRKARDQRVTFAAVVLCGILVSPHVYVYDALLAGAGLFLVAQAALERGWHRRSDVTAYALHWSPLLLPFVEVTRVQIVTLLMFLWLFWAARELDVHPNRPDDLSDVGHRSPIPIPGTQGRMHHGPAT